MGCNCGGARYRPPQQPSILPKAVGLPTSAIITPVLPSSAHQEAPKEATTPTTNKVPTVQQTARRRGGYVIPPNGGPGGA